MILLKCSRVEGTFVYFYEQEIVEHVLTHRSSMSHSEILKSNK